MLGNKRINIIASKLQSTTKHQRLWSPSPLGTTTAISGHNNSFTNVLSNNHFLFAQQQQQQLRFAGHNKWSKIRHKKKVTDGEKMKKLGKCSKEITSAIRESNGDTDPSSNLRLRLILDKARKMNMPKTVIDRAIKSATDKDALAMERILYEGTGPCGVGFVIECLTDKRTRTAQNMRIAFKDNKGTMGTKTLWCFQQRGSVVCSLFVPHDKVTDSIKENMELVMMDLLNEEEEYHLETVDHSDSDEAQLIAFTEVRFIVLTEPAKVHDLNRTLLAGFVNSEQLKQECHVQRSDSEMSVIYHPTMTVDVVNQEDTENLLEIVSTLEDDDDVVSVFHNARFVDE